MENLAFLRSKIFSKYYIIMTNVALSLSLVFNVLGILGNVVIQLIAGTLVILGAGFLFGTLLDGRELGERLDKIGWILIRFSYVTLFVMILGMLSIAGGSAIASFYLLGDASLQATVLLSSVGLTSFACFGICYSAICYHTLSLELVWNV